MGKYKFSVNVDITSFKGGYYDKVNREFINREYKVVRL